MRTGETRCHVFPARRQPFSFTCRSRIPGSGRQLWEALVDQESCLQGMDPRIVVLEESVLIRGYGSFRITHPPSVPRIADTAGDSRGPPAAWPSGIRTACICNNREVIFSRQVVHRLETCDHIPVLTREFKKVSYPRDLPGEGDLPGKRQYRVVGAGLRSPQESRPFETGDAVLRINR